MTLRSFLLFFGFALSLAARDAGAALREPRPSENAIRVLADAKAEQPSPPARELQAAPSAAALSAGAVGRDESLRRELIEHTSMLNARFDDLDAKIYEIVSRVQLLTGCLIALFLGMAVWQISIARQIAQLRSRSIEQSSGFR
jgi:hypothetical protein